MKKPPLIVFQKIWNEIQVRSQFPLKCYPFRENGHQFPHWHSSALFGVHSFRMLPIGGGTLEFVKLLEEPVIVS